jgi:predicted phage terminase large subunit-like protein
VSPHPKQAVFLLAPQLEVLFGGAAGGGKSEGGLAGFAQYADIPTYKGIIFRRTFRDLALPGALMDRAHEWWDGTEARWSSQDYSWRFPSGAILQFAYLETDKDRFRYQSAEFQYIFFDELTQFTELQYTYLFSRLRKLTSEALEKMGVEIDLPIRMRAATNPGGVGHEWVKKRFIGTESSPVRHPNRIFIPSLLKDNPSLEQETYRRSLAELDPVTRKQLEDGDWTASGRGGKFKRHWWRIETSGVPRRFQYIVRFWDMAATEAKEGDDPDYTVGTKLGLDLNNQFWVLDVKRFRGTPAQNEKIIADTAAADGIGIDIFMEQEPGASGKIAIDHYRRNVLFGYPFRSNRATGQKEIRANPVSSAVEGGLVHLVYADWNEPFLDEHDNFPDSAHDDQVDSLSGAHFVITRKLKALKRHRAKQSSSYPTRAAR